MKSQNITHTVRDAVRKAVAEDQLELPTLPEIALRIREAAQSDSVSAAALCQVIGQDPGLAAHLVKVANSPMFRGAQAIDDLQMATSRLGVEYAANLATGLAMSQMFQSTSEMIDRSLRSVWAHACDVAAIAGVIAKSFTKLRPDQATLAGLTHSVGTLPIFTFVEANPDLINDSITLESVIESLRGSLGTMILQSWGFPEEIAMVPAHYEDFDRVVAAADLIDVVMIANMESLAGTNHPHANLDPAAIGAYSRIGFDPQGEPEALAQFQEDVASAKATLRSG